MSEHSASGADVDRTVRGAKGGMAADEVDAIFAELAAAVTALIAEGAIADRDRDEWSEESETFVAQEPEMRRWPHPRRALVDARYDITRATAIEFRKASRELAAWWADAVTCAAVMTARGVPVDSVQLAAGDPTAFLEGEDLDALPAPAESERVLAGLAARMGGAEMAVLAQQVATRAGLTVRESADGVPVVVDDVFPDGRRCRMWGPLWSDHRLPALPGADELADLLEPSRVAPSIIEEIRAARATVQDVIDAELRISAEEDPEAQQPLLQGDEFDRLCEHAEQATVILADYARVLTGHLPAIRAAAANSKIE